MAQRVRWQWEMYRRWAAAIAGVRRGPRRPRLPRAPGRVCWPASPVRSAITVVRGMLDPGGGIEERIAQRGAVVVMSSSARGSWLPGPVYCSTIASATASARRTLAGRAATAAATRASRRLRDGSDYRLLAAGEVVVVGPRRDPGSLGDVVNVHVVRPALQGQPQPAASRSALLVACFFLSRSPAPWRRHGTSIPLKDA